MIHPDDIAYDIKNSHYKRANPDNYYHDSYQRMIDRWFLVSIHILAFVPVLPNGISAVIAYSIGMFIGYMLLMAVYQLFVITHKGFLSGYESLKDWLSGY